MRATNLVIGTTTLAVVAAGFISMLVVQKVRAVRNQNPIRIVFDGSASGLRKGGPVNFDGVPAGQILSIKLENPRKIVVLAMLSGLGNAVFHPADYAILSGSVSSEKMGRSFALHTFTGHVGFASACAS